VHHTHARPFQEEFVTAHRKEKNKLFQILVPCIESKFSGKTNLDKQLHNNIREVLFIPRGL